MRYLEPGKKRRRSRPSLTWTLWLVAAGMAVALAIQVLVR
jgi:hypothetical protein